MTRTNNWVRTGRIDSRRLCASCEARILYGDPLPSDTWAGRLRLTREQLDLLLCAAAEFIEAGDGSAVEFVDWITLSVLGKTVVRDDHDGSSYAERTRLTRYDPERRQHRCQGS